MTDSRRGPLDVVNGRNLCNEYGTSGLVTDGGALERFDVTGCSHWVSPGCSLPDGLGGLWLRYRAKAGMQLISLIGQSTPTTVTAVVAIQAE